MKGKILFIFIAIAYTIIPIYVFAGDDNSNQQGITRDEAVVLETFGEIEKKDEESDLKQLKVNVVSKQKKIENVQKLSEVQNAEAVVIEAFEKVEKQEEVNDMKNWCDFEDSLSGGPIVF